jgi:heparinase II/III-like protein
VEENLSYYFSPNTHLLGEGLALYVTAAALPELASSPRRLALGRRILLDERARQIAADGGHCERSTHYHRYALDFYTLAAIVARVTHDPAADAFADAVGRLGYAARLLADERGRLPHIGDDDGGSLTPITGRAADDIRDSLAVAAFVAERRNLQIDRAPEEAIWLLNGLAGGVDAQAFAYAPMRSAALADTGYYVSRTPLGDHLVIDGGPHGYQNGGHAHADALSLTFSRRGLPLLIDPGTGCYTTDPALRDRLRGTALHNTLTLDDTPQSIPRGPFHWSATANASAIRWRANDGFDYFDGAHHGYAPFEHRRRVLSLQGDLIVVADLVSGDAPESAAQHAAAVHWHIDPRWTLDLHDRHVSFMRAGERVSLIVPDGFVEAFVGDAATGLGWYSPVYGRVDRTTTVRVSHCAAPPFWIVSVFDLSAENPVADVEWMPVWAEAGTIERATALRITRAASTDYVLFAEPTEDAVAAAAPDDPDADALADAVRSRRITWRVGEIETDARMLYCRVSGERPVTRVAIVDGSFVRASGRRGFLIELPHFVPDLHLDLSAGARVAGAATAAVRLVVGGRDHPIAIDRRSTPRSGTLDWALGTRGSGRGAGG